MPYLRFALMTLLLTPLGLLSARAQETQRTADISPQAPDSILHKNGAGMYFDRNLNTYNWIGRLVLDTAAAGTHIALNELYTSNVILVDAGPGSRKKLESNQENLLLQLKHPLSTDLSALVQWSSLVYSDRKSVGLSNASIHSLLGGIEYVPFPFVALTPMAGYRWDNQADIRDRGLTTYLAAQTRGIDLDGTQITGAAQYREDHLDPRKIDSHFARLGAQKYFSAPTRDSIEIGVYHTRREFYALADSNIESRLDNVFSFTNLLDYDINRNFLATLFLTLNSRGLDKDYRRTAAAPPPGPLFDTRIEEFRLETFLQASYRSTDNRSTGSLRLSYSERNETHSAKPIPNASPGVLALYNERNRQELTKDNFAQRSSLAGMASFPLSLSDRISVAGAASILRYDTPSDLNYEDRDELLVAASITTTHRITRSFEAAVTLDGNLSHLVYLLKERSANNNINRVLRLSPRTTFRPGRFFTTTNGFEVLANYTVYDFEEQTALVRSFSYRQFGWIDSTTVQFTDRLALDCFLYLKLYQRGQLRWSEFTERLENSFADQTYAAQLRFSPGTGAVFAVGLQYFSQIRYSYSAAEKEITSFLRSFGPTCAILWDVGNRGQLSLRGWYEDRKQPDGTSRTLGNMSMTLLLTL
jgi:hypothetical protein